MVFLDNLSGVNSSCSRIYLVPTLPALAAFIHLLDSLVLLLVMLLLLYIS